MALHDFEQNVCKVLKVRQTPQFAGTKSSFSTGFSTDFVEKREEVEPVYDS
jgi:hypothetical protein